jgi:tetratricopeptide (TPR) repeat protein
VRILLAVGLTCAVLGAAAGPAAAEDQNAIWCTGGPGISADQQISGCAVIIQAGGGTAANLATAFYNRGNAYGKKGDDDSAIADYSRAIQLRPDYAKAFHNRGDAYMRKGDYDRAIADFSQAIQFEPEYARAFGNRGFAYMRKRDYDHAIADFERYLQLEPNDEKARGFLEKAQQARAANH